MAAQYPAWSWVDVVADQREMGRQSFTYVYRCPGCDKEQLINSTDVQARNEHTGGRCPECHGNNTPAKFWEVLEPIERFTVKQRDGASFVVTLYRLPPGTDPDYKTIYRDTFRAVVSSDRHPTYVTIPNAQPYYALTAGMEYVARRALKVAELPT